MPSFRIQYPKLLLLCTSFAAAYMLYHAGYFDLLPHILNGKGYISMLLAGALFCLGFTAPFGLFIIIEMAPEVNPFLGALVGGAGAMLVDMIIFQIARVSLQEELHRLAAAGWFRRAIQLLYHEKLSDRIRSYIIWVFAGFIIASPLPDEIGLTMLSGVATIEPRRLAIVCFILDVLGILAVLLMTRAAL